MTEKKVPVGRFAPTPSGRMHLGNVFTAMLAWLSVRSQGGRLVLRMEDLDTQRTTDAYADMICDDLLWLGLGWDIQSQAQSLRSEIYDGYFAQLQEKGLLYPCYCTRSQLHSADAPHLSDGTYVYPGTCRNLTDVQHFDRAPAWRVQVPDRQFAFDDLVQGHYSQNLLQECGDFVVRRADGVYVYQLAVTVDDALSGVTEVVRGMDLISSSPRQMYLQELFGFEKVRYAHVPMLLSSDGRRLSKRDRDLDMGALRARTTPERVLGVLAHAAGLTQTPAPVAAQELATEFSWEKVRKTPVYVDVTEL